MGALHKSLDPVLVNVLRRVLGLEVLVESLATDRPSAASVVPGFKRVEALGLGPSPDLTEASILYWLDSHWIDSSLSAPEGPCPIPDELARIGTLNSQSILVIDDARHFLTTGPKGAPQDHWPDISSLTDALSALSPGHRMWVINDMVILAPTTVADLIRDYDQTSGLNLPRTISLARLGSQHQANHRHVAQQRQMGRAVFNAAFQGARRPETIFSFHLGRMGIRRVLDIGANTGQFGETLRAMGYDGEILSVEPQITAHRDLLAATRKDDLWCALPRQATGAVRGFVDLKISENSVSSSLRSVHANHINADRATTQVAIERVFASRSGDLLKGHLMAGIEALKIDVQGFEDQVLEGYRPWLGGVRLLLVELSIVECYEGAPDLFTLDRRIVEEFGFSRISLEPAYYDDVTGVVQQYDGIYYRPDLPPASRASSPPTRSVSSGDLRTLFHEAEPGIAIILGQDPDLEALNRAPVDWLLGLEAAVGMCMRVPSELVDDLRGQPDLLEGFSLDEPGWDIALAVIGLARGYVFKQVGGRKPRQGTGSQSDIDALQRLLGRLSAEPAGHCPDLVQDLADRSETAGLMHAAVLDLLG